MNISEDKLFDLHKQISVRLRLSLLHEQHFPFLSLWLSQHSSQAQQLHFPLQSVAPVSKRVFFPTAASDAVELWRDDAVHPGKEEAGPLQRPWPSGSSALCCRSTLTFQRKAVSQLQLKPGPQNTEIGTKILKGVVQSQHIPARSGSTCSKPISQGQSGAPGKPLPLCLQTALLATAFLEFCTIPDVVLSWLKLT